MKIWLDLNQMINIKIKVPLDEISCTDAKIFVENNKFIFNKEKTKSKD